MGEGVAVREFEHCHECQRFTLLRDKEGKPWCLSCSLANGEALRNEEE